MTRQSTISEKPSSSPGKTPAMNSALIEIVPPVASEYSTALWLGGTNRPPTAGAVVRLGGKHPARNRAAIEIVPPVGSEYSTALWLGGTNSPCTEEVMVRLVANTRG